MKPPPTPTPPTPRTGVLVMAHGTPATPEEVEPFYTSIRRGSPPPPELLADLVRRYDALGGISPLATLTHDQVEGLATALETIAPGAYIVRYGAKHTLPNIEEGVAALQAAHVQQIIGIVLTPHQSSLGSGEYLRRAADAAAVAVPPLGFVGIPSWHRAPGFASLLAARTRSVLAALTPAQRQKTSVFFTAHSLPARVIAEGDPYPDQVLESATDIAELLGLDTIAGLEWGVAWQSAGRTADPWIGPDLLAEITRVAASGATSVVVCPVGFVSDHLEVLFDLDIEAADVARPLGVTFARTPSLNNDPQFMSVLANLIHATSASTSTSS